MMAVPARLLLPEVMSVLMVLLVLYQPGVVHAQNVSAAAFYSCATLWDAGRIPYVIQSGFTSSDLAVVTQVFDNFHTYTPIRFVPRNGESAYLDIGYTFEENYCGYVQGLGKGSPRILRLNPQCISSAEPGTVYHELMHAIGIAHEHVRTGRDECITVHASEICSLFRDQYDASPTQSYGEPYDYKSVMHYDGFSASCTGNPTMEANQGGVSPAGLGNDLMFTQIDVNKLNKMYGAATVTVPGAPASVTCSVSAADAECDCIPKGKGKGKCKCFHGKNTVITREGGIKPVGDVKVGDWVLSVDELRAETRYSRVYLLNTHLPRVLVDDYICIEGEGGRDGSLVLVITTSHLLYRAGASGPALVPAGEVKLGDILYTPAHGETSRVTSITAAPPTGGAYSFEVQHGSPVVSGVMAASYSDVITPAHVNRDLKWPIRMLFKFGYVGEEGDGGIPGWLMEVGGALVHAMADMYTGIYA